jgi:hypothetical protein
MDSLSEGDFIRDPEKDADLPNLDPLRALLEGQGWTRDDVERWIEDHRELFL